MTRILYLGEIGAGQTALMRMRAMERLGHEVLGYNTNTPWKNAGWLRRQVERRLSHGQVVDEINDAALDCARRFQPALVWADKQQFLRRGTLEKIRRLGARLVHFTPDPYFSLGWKRTRLMDDAIEAFDILVYCKAYERADYEKLGKSFVYMPLGYCDEVHRPLPSDDPRWRCDIGFIGGWEPRRERMLHAIAARGAHLSVRGVAWDFLADGRWTLRRHLVLGQLAGKDPFRIHRDPQLAAGVQGGDVYADDYARALTGAKIGLGFLRTVCDDQHTTRTFEIPACGSMLLADRTDEHQSFFEEGKEADFFGSDEELINKIEFYLANEAARSRIAAAGLERCRTGRYAYIHRMADALTAIEQV
jgi:spore maturation protein CgeB